MATYCGGIGAGMALRERDKYRHRRGVMLSFATAVGPVWCHVQADDGDASPSAKSFGGGVGGTVVDGIFRGDRGSDGAVPPSLYGTLVELRRDGQVRITRDRLGTRGAYWTVFGDGSVVFGSEADAVAATQPSREISIRWLRSALAGDVLGWNPWLYRQTVWAEVRRVAPGAVCTLVPARPAEEVEVWDLPTTWREDMTVDAAADQLHQALRVAVRDWCSGPVGISLSGGLDSSVIAAVACEELGRDRVVGFTFVYDPLLLPGQRSELEASRRLAKVLGIRQIVIEAGSGRLFHGVEGLMRALDEPRLAFGDASARLMCEATKTAGIRTLLVGDGGDHLCVGPGCCAADLIIRGRWREAARVARIGEPRWAKWPSWLMREALDVGRQRRWPGWLNGPRPRSRARLRFVSGVRTFGQRQRLWNLMSWMGSGDWHSRTFGRRGLVLLEPFGHRAVMEAALSVPPWLQMGETGQKRALLRVLQRDFGCEWMPGRTKWSNGGQIARCLREAWDELSQAFRGEHLGVAEVVANDGWVDALVKARQGVFEEDLFPALHVALMELWLEARRREERCITFRKEEECEDVWASPTLLARQ